MILPMYKYSFLVYHGDYEKFLDDIRVIGVVDVIEKKDEDSEEIKEKYDLVKQITTTIKFLEKRGVEQKKQTTKNGKGAFEEINKLRDEQEEKLQQLITLQKEISLVRPWGDFSIDTLERLKENGINLKFYTCSAKRFGENWAKEFPIEVVAKHGGNIYFVVVECGDEAIELEAEEVKAPEKPVSELKYYEKRLEEDIRNIEKEFDKHAAQSIKALEDYRKEVWMTNEYEKVWENTLREADEKVMLLEGWVPVKKADELDKYLEMENILFVKTEPDPEKEKVPVLLKNKKFSEKFEMLGELYSLPKYNELDLTPFFAPFYMLFFGFCLGDAGYGILLAVTALVARGKVKKELKNVMMLIFYLGVSTFFFGLISGTLFGIDLYATKLPVYGSLNTYMEARGTDINEQLFNLSLVLGGLQIIFGLFLKAINETIQMGWKFALSTIGWIILIIGGGIVFVLSKFAELPVETVNILLYSVLGVSGLFIFILNHPRRNVFVNIGAGLWNTYNMVTGVLGDLLSYIRLFALGISSAILGYVFNSLAVSMSGSIPVVSIIIMIIILVIGHGINLFMSGLGSFVHPMRLTFVEFYKNAGFTGGGKQYSPFRKLR